VAGMVTTTLLFFNTNNVDIAQKFIEDYLLKTEGNLNLKNAVSPIKPYKYMRC
jgi:hypothetical protein